MIANPSDDIIKRLWITHKHAFGPVARIGRKEDENKNVHVCLSPVLKHSQNVHS